MRAIDTLRLFTLAAAASALLLSGCGGGGSTSGVVNAIPTTTTLQGVAAKGLIKGGTIRVYTLTSTGDINQKQQLAPAVTSSSVDGRYSVNIGTHTGIVLLEATGSYVDEADGIMKPLAAPLRAALVVGSGGGTVNAAITPFTEIAVKLALTVNSTVGTVLTEEAISASNTLVSGLLPFDILSDLPVEPSNTEMNAISAARQDYTLALAAVSRLASSSSLNGIIEDYRQQLYTTNRLSLATVNAFQTALDAFLASPLNHTGYHASTPGLQKFGYYTTTLKVHATGNFATTDIIKGIQLTIGLPAGMSVKTDANSIPLSGIITASGNAATGSYFEPASYDSTVNALTFVLINDTGFGSGEFATIKLQTSPTISPPIISDFTQSNVTVVTKGGDNITGLTTISFSIPN